MRVQCVYITVYYCSYFYEIKFKTLVYGWKRFRATKETWDHQFFFYISVAFFGVFNKLGLLSDSRYVGIVNGARPKQV